MKTGDDDKYVLLYSIREAKKHFCMLNISFVISLFDYLRLQLKQRRVDSLYNNTKRPSGRCAGVKSEVTRHQLPTVAAA